MICNITIYKYSNIDLVYYSKCIYIYDYVYNSVWLIHIYIHCNIVQYSNSNSDSDSAIDSNNVTAYIM